MATKRGGRPAKPTLPPYGLDLVRGYSSDHLNAAFDELLMAARGWRGMTDLYLKKETRRLRRAIDRWDEVYKIELDSRYRAHLAQSAPTQKEEPAK